MGNSRQQDIFHSCKEGAGVPEVWQDDLNETRPARQGGHNNYGYHGGNILAGLCRNLVSAVEYEISAAQGQKPDYNGVVSFHTTVWVSTFSLLSIACASLAFETVVQVLKPSITAYYVDLLDLCNYHLWLQISMYTFLWITVLIGVFVQWKIRNIKSSLNKSCEMLIMSIVVVIVLAFGTVMRYILLQYHFDLCLRLINTALNHLAAHSMWWFIMAVPIYKSLFDRQRYLDSWIQKLRDDGVHKEYDIDLTAVAYNDPTISTAYNRNIMLMITRTNGNKKGGAFYAIDNNVYNSKDASFGDGSHPNLYKHVDCTADTNTSIEYRQQFETGSGRAV
ncbi:hypothetical protein BX661DRAFT_168749 [Kickxella alabastrina]|uniref:uncharacterized protein n=1 Tax=Kickxella alabastrina TaxID=61397 RepID=UPI00221E7217|nr:uncharacterized protein BX661DRAFT_168749 [Kickxella alabastrina]KAI7833597.1 hypothetical protein BX661DRAFT_168749 [Kickxella alabastrina]KAJ1938194.1 hypothetical protein GGF37_004904 [Kickxella alabastrina]